MKRQRGYFLIMSLLSILFFGLSLAAHAETDASAPLIVINERSFDAKDVEEGVSVEHTYKVLNKGGQPLEINKVKTS